MTQTKSAQGQRKPQSGAKFSGSFVVTVSVVVALISFVAGTRGSEILGAVGQTLGITSISQYSNSLDLSSLESTYSALSQKYDGDLDEKKLVEYANKGMASATGDEYTQYFTKAEAEELQDELSGNIGGGIGAELGKRNDKVTIIRPLENSPAQKAGLAAGDAITAVNGESMLAATVDDVVKRVRGEIGSTVKLSVSRDGDVKEFSVTREEIVAPDVESKIEDNVGVLTVSRFDRDTGANVRAAAEDFKKQGVEGVVLDLRGNGGGYLDAGVDVASVWLNDKVVVSERRDGKVIDERKSAKNAILADTPTVVLINAGSASASEIVAGALHDHKAAKLVGEKSFGKGSVQELIDINGGAQLKVTVARWYTPAGKNITKEGIDPDVEVELTSDDVDANKDPQLSQAIKSLR